MIADQGGYFTLEARAGDSLEFSHLGYHSSRIELPAGELEQDTMYLEIFMTRVKAFYRY